MSINLEEYFEYLIAQYQNLIYSICLQSVGNPFDAEDLTQDVFLSAYKNLDDFDRTFEKAWLCKIASRKCLDFLKQSGRKVLPTQEEYFLHIPDSSKSSPEYSYLENESKQQVYQLCQKLKSPYREVAVAYFCNEFTMQEIAACKEKSIKTIQTQVYRAKAMLRKMIRRSN